MSPIHQDWWLYILQVECGNLRCARFWLVFLSCSIKRLALWPDCHLNVSLYDFVLLFVIFLFWMTSPACYNLDILGFVNFVFRSRGDLGLLSFFFLIQIVNGMFWFEMFTRFSLVFKAPGVFLHVFFLFFRSTTRMLQYWSLDGYSKDVASGKRRVRVFCWFSSRYDAGDDEETW